jgi:hypothetical protein
MREDAVFEILDSALKPLGSRPIDGVSLRQPSIEVLRFYYRPVRLHWLPVLGRALSVVAVFRKPAELSVSPTGCRESLRRAAIAANGRFPPLRLGGGLSIGLCAIALAEQPITPGDDAILQQSLAPLPRTRAVPLGLIRLNLSQEAMSFALASGPGGLFHEPVALADALAHHFRRYVTPIEA